MLSMRPAAAQQDMRSFHSPTEAAFRQHFAALVLLAAAVLLSVDAGELAFGAEEPRVPKS
jgi:hypothetical protein